MADGQQTFDSVQDYVAHRSEQRAAAREEAGISEDEYNEADGAVEADDTEEEIETVADDVMDEEDTADADPALADADDDPETDSVEGDVDEVQESEPETAVVAPQYLGKEEKDLFEKMTPDAKKLFVEADSRREAFVTKKSQELSAVRQAFEQRMQGLDGFVTETERAIREYQDVDWEAAARELTPQDFQIHKARFEGLHQQLKEASSKRTEAERTELTEYTREQSGVLRSLAETDASAKALLDPSEGPKRMGKLKEYLAGQGVDDATLRWASAPAVVLGYKAMKYDEAQSKAKQKPLPQRKPAGKTVAPSTPAQARTSTSTKLKQLQAKTELSPAEFKQLQKLKRAQRAS